MNKRIYKILIVFSAILMAGCSGYNKLLKSGDQNLMYQKALEFYNAKKYQKTIQLFDEIAHFYTSTSREDTIAYYTAAAHYKTGDFETSGLLLDDYRRKFGRSPFIEEAEYMYAKGFYFASPAPERDQTVTRQAILSIGEYLNRYPNSVKKEMLNENIGELQQKLYDKSFINAKTYYNIGKYNSAVTALRNAVSEYPESNHREELMYLVVKSSYLLATNSVAKMQRDRFMNMMDTYYTFAGDYPQSKYMKEVDKMLEDAKINLETYKATEDATVEEGATKNTVKADSTAKPIMQKNIENK